MTPSPIGLEAAELDRVAEGLRELTVELHFDRRALEGLGAIVILRELAEAAAALPPSPVEGWKPDREAVARVIDSTPRSGTRPMGQEWFDDAWLLRMADIKENRDWAEREKATLLAKADQILVLASQPRPSPVEEAARDAPDIEEALLGQLQRAADGGYDYSRTKGLCDRAAVLIAIYRDIFAEITAKAVPRSGTDPADPERITSYVIPTGPLHRAAGKLGFQMFDGERHLAAAMAEIARLDALASQSPAGSVEPQKDYGA